MSKKASTRSEEGEWATVTKRPSSSSLQKASSLQAAVSSVPSKQQQQQQQSFKRKTPIRRRPSSRSKTPDKQTMNGPQLTQPSFRKGKRSQSFSNPNHNNTNNNKASLRRNSSINNNNNNKSSLQQHAQSQQPNNKKKQQQQQQQNRPKTLAAEVSLYNHTPSGTNKQHQAVLRHSAESLLQQRIHHLDFDLQQQQTNKHSIHQKCLWTADNRLDRIQAWHDQFVGYQPLQQSETRWQPKVMKQQQQPSNTTENDDDDDTKLVRLQAILNKMSWTKLNKLTLQFLHVLGPEIQPHLLQNSMRLVLNKAVLEPHFGQLYATLVSKLTTIHKAFKKCILSLCQQSFAEQQQQTNNDNTKARIGLVTFIGHLYVLELLKPSIIRSIVEQLLHDPQHESKLESACKLLHIVGHKLTNDQNNYNDTTTTAALDPIWKRIHTYIDQKMATQRIRFLLEALVELQENDWVNIRHMPEQATTLQNVRQQQSTMPVTRTSGQLKRSVSSDGASPTKVPHTRVARSQSTAVLPSVVNNKNNNNKNNLLEPDQCARKTVRLLQEYFINDEVQDTILTLDGWVAPSMPGSHQRATAILQAGILYCMEQKMVQIQKFVTLLSHWEASLADPVQVVRSSLVVPLECLRDIEIDAPMAASLLAVLCSHWMSVDYIGIADLANLSDTFAKEGSPADFIKQIFAVLQRPPTNEERGVVQGFLGNDDGSVSVEAFLGQ